jgi:hypothetical protein
MSLLPGVLGACLAVLFFREARQLRRTTDMSQWHVSVHPARRQAAARYFSHVATLAGVFFLSVLLFYVLPRRQWGWLAPLPLALIGSIAYGMWRFAPPRERTCRTGAGEELPG